MQLSVLGALGWSPALGGALRHLHVRGAPRPPHLGWSHQCHPCPPDLGGTISPCAPVLRGQLCKSRAGRSPGLSFSLHIVFCRGIYLVFLLIIRIWGLPASISAPSPDRACSCCHPAPGVSVGCSEVTSCPPGHGQEPSPSLLQQEPSATQESLQGKGICLAPGPPSSPWGCPAATGLGKKGFGNEISGAGEGSCWGSSRQIKSMYK